MRFSYQPNDLNFEFSENQSVNLCIENPVIFREIIHDIALQCSGEDGDVILSENNKEISIAKSCELILSPFSLDYNNRKIKAQLFKSMKSISDDVLCNRFLMLQSEIQAYIEEIAEDLPYAISYDKNLDENALFKLEDVHIDEVYTTLAEKIDEYIKLNAQLLNTSALFLVDMANYLTDQERQEIYKTAYYYKVTLVQINSSVHKILPEEKTVIIDRDSCIIEL